MLFCNSEGNSVPTKATPKDIEHFHTYLSSSALTLVKQAELSEERPLVASLPIAEKAGADSNRSVFCDLFCGVQREEGAV